MYTKWTSHCKTEQEKAQFEADLRRAKPILDRLKSIVDEEKYLLNSQSEDFTVPAWPYQQASIIGAKKALKNIKKLIDRDKQKDTTNE